MSTDAIVRSPNGAAQRIADTLLRVVGGRAVSVRILTQPSQGDGGQLGQPSPGYQDYTLAPAVFRRVTPPITSGEPNRYELLVSSSAVQDLAATGITSDAMAVFNTAVGIVVDSQLLRIDGVVAAQAFGQPYIYTLTLRDQ